MGRIFRVLLALFFAQLVFMGRAAGQYVFDSPQQLRKYLEQCIDSLDPLEGEYDLEFSQEVITPFEHLPRGGWERWRFFIVKTYEDIPGKYDAYSVFSDGDFAFTKLSFVRLGETNAYRCNMWSSSVRFPLMNDIHFDIKLVLDPESGKKWSGSPLQHPSVKDILYFDGIKVYPTSSMYSEARLKRAAEEARLMEEASKPTEWSGTGFALRGNHIVTNYHVVEDAKSINVTGINGDFVNFHEASVVAVDRQNDLAILKVSGVSIASAGIPYSVKNGTSEVGEEVFTLGYPMITTMGDEIKLTTGVVSSKSGFQGNYSQYQVSAATQSGSSGGPMFDSKGNVAGIVVAKHAAAENASYAIKSVCLRNLVESAGLQGVLPQSNKISSLGLSQKVKAVKGFVYCIVCSSKGAVASASSSAMDEVGCVRSSSEVHIDDFTIQEEVDSSLILEFVKLRPDETVLGFACVNDYLEGWMHIYKNAYIQANGRRYYLRSADGIAYEPEKTYFSHYGEAKRFTLHFPPLPDDVRSIDFVERPSSPWRMYGIRLR